MSEPDSEHSDEDAIEVNLDLTGSCSRKVDPLATFSYVSHLELIEVLRKRYDQLNDPYGPHNTINPSVIDRFKGDASPFRLMLAELVDATVEYPVLIARGDAHYRIHKDLKLNPTTLDIFVLTLPNGEISYNHVLDDLRNFPNAENEILKREIERKAK
jgi:hypothetical protein